MITEEFVINLDKMVKTASDFLDAYREWYKSLSNKERAEIAKIELELIEKKRGIFRDNAEGEK